MATVEYGNFYYFAYMILGAIISLGVIKLLKSKTKRYQYIFLLFLLLFGLILHFTKVLFVPYNALDYPFRKASLENICAVNSVVFLFIYLSKNKTLKDYMVMSGIFSGLITFVFPVNAISVNFDGEFLGKQSAFSFEVIRFYLSHLILFLVPFTMMHYQMHKLSFKRAYRAPIMFFLVLMIIWINELIITMLGWIPKENLYDPNKRNPSMIFGIKDEMAALMTIVIIFVPLFMRVHPLTGETFFWPVFWMIIPLIIYTSLIIFIFMFIYEREDTISFLKRRMYEDEHLKHKT
jgi:hypothetical protein